MARCHATSPIDRAADSWLGPDLLYAVFSYLEADVIKRILEFLTLKWLLDRRRGRRRE